MGGAAVPFREAATPDRAVVVGGLGETPRNCDDDTIVTARINEIRSLSLISALRVNSRTCGWLARNKGIARAAAMPAAPPAIFSIASKGDYVDPA
jgi:hypothetical protein